MVSDGAASPGAADERLSALSDDRPDPERARGHPRQAIAGLAQAVHDGASLQQGRRPVRQRRAGGRDVLRRDRPLCLTELGIEIESGQVLGELAMLAPDNRRTATLECVENGKVLSITYEQVFGFYFLRLATARLFDNINRLETELTRQRAAPAWVHQDTEIIAVSMRLCGAFGGWV
jgi:hypothetical protein